MVYVIKCGEFYKIGFTSGRDVQPRIKTLQIGTPHTLELIDVWPGEQKHEAELHVRFKKRHVRGEWFALTHADLMWIAGVAHITRAVYGYPQFEGQRYSKEPAPCS